MKKHIVPYFLGHLFAGATICLPGLVIQDLNPAFGWDMSAFGQGMMTYGILAFISMGICGLPAFRHRIAFLHNVGVVAAFLGLLTLFALPALLGQLNSGHALWLPYLGLGLNGVGNGLITMTNTSRVVSEPRASMLIHLLNVGFVLGACLYPVVAQSVIVASQAHDFHPSGMPSWTLPGVLMAAFWLLIPILRMVLDTNLAQVAPVTEQPGASAVRLPAPMALWLPASLMLFFYIGIEINMSNTVTSMATALFGADKDSARLMMSVYWGGLVFVRLVLSALKIPEKKYPKIVAVSAIPAAAFLFLGSQGVTLPFALGLLMVFAIGVFIGGTYSMGLSALNSVKGVDGGIMVNRGAMGGALGSILLPAFYGHLLDSSGLGGGLLGMTVFLGLMGAAAWVLGRQVDAMTHEEPLEGAELKAKVV